MNWIAFGILASACGGGFAILLSFYIKLSNRLNNIDKKISVELEKKVSFTWIEDKIEKKIDNIIETLNKLKVEISKIKEQN